MSVNEDTLSLQDRANELRQCANARYCKNQVFYSLALIHNQN